MLTSCLEESSYEEEEGSYKPKMEQLESRRCLGPWGISWPRAPALAGSSISWGCLLKYKIQWFHPGLKYLESLISLLLKGRYIAYCYDKWKSLVSDGYIWNSTQTPKPLIFFSVFNYNSQKSVRQVLRGSPIYLGGDSWKIVYLRICF